jgi:hypothetical protein
MSRPSDEAIAAAFWEMFTEADIHCEWWRVKPDIVNRAFEIDAEAAGPALPNDGEVMQIERSDDSGLHPVASAALFEIDDEGKSVPLFQFKTKGCWCETCRPITIHDQRFIVCPDCGNKRCPKANDHRNACTNSNEVGQPGSSWEQVKPFAHTIPEKVTTSPEHAYIPHDLVKCPRCPALMPPGLSCKGNPPDDPCPMRK